MAISRRRLLTMPPKLYAFALSVPDGGAAGGEHDTRRGGCPWLAPSAGRLQPDGPASPLGGPPGQGERM